MEKQYIILINASCKHAESICDQLRGRVIENFEIPVLKGLEFLDGYEGADAEETWITMEIDEFVETYNTAGSDHENWYMTYVYLKNQQDV